MSETITGLLFRDAVISAAANITAHRQDVDELNVFPVPDGDTGTNMSMTINNASRELSMVEEGDLSTIASKASAALLRGARGNSGVILSLLFRGIAKGLKGCETADGVVLASALQSGVNAAYKAVMKPTEGTVLTVSRMAAENAVKVAEENNDPVVFESALEAAKVALANTPEQLPVLKKAGVVDAGGQGFVYILEGMLSVFKYKEIVGFEEAPEYEKIVQKTEVKYTYSIDYTVNRSSEVQNDPIKLRAFLETIGDNVSVNDTGDSIKVSVCSDNPGLAIEEGIKFGQLVDITVENMRIKDEKEQHANSATTSTSDGTSLKPVAIEKKFGFVSVAAGEGLCNLFKDLGADVIVEGGQTMNPSTDDILCAIESTPAEIVFVLPNNKNIIMAAEQAIPLATRKVCVLPTRTIPMGISAMLAFDEDLEVEDNLIAMGKAADRTSTGQVTYAARDSVFDGKEINKGEILALKNGKITFVEQDMVRAVSKLTKSLVTKDTTLVTLIYGKDVDEETLSLASMAVEAKAGNAEVTIIDGGQPVYYFIISAE